MIDRLFNILKAYSGYGKKIPKSDSKNYQDFYSDNESQYTHSSNENNSPYSQELVDDLAVFGLTPPSSFDEVKKARNKEMRKYHPDKFNNQEDKGGAANEIAQIYNEAFGRLKVHFEGK